MYVFTCGYPSHNSKCPTVLSVTNSSRCYCNCMRIEEWSTTTSNACMYVYQYLQGRLFAEFILDRREPLNGIMALWHCHIKLLSKLPLHIILAGFMVFKCGSIGVPKVRTVTATVYDCLTLLTFNATTYVVYPGRKQMLTKWWLECMKTLHKCLNWYLLLTINQIGIRFLLIWNDVYDMSLTWLILSLYVTDEWTHECALFWIRIKPGINHASPWMA